jgi:hypothetical protein
MDVKSVYADADLAKFHRFSHSICLFESDFGFASFMSALRVQILPSDLRESKGDTASIRLILLVDYSSELLSILRKLNSYYRNVNELIQIDCLLQTFMRKY